MGLKSKNFLLRCHSDPNKATISPNITEKSPKRNVKKPRLALVQRHLKIWLPKKTCIFLQSLKLGCMSSKGPMGENSHYIFNNCKNLKHFHSNTKNLKLFIFILSAEKTFGDYFIGQANNASRTCDKKMFLQQWHIKSMTWPANNSNNNSSENLWWKMMKIVNDNTPTCKANLASTITKLS